MNRDIPSIKQGLSEGQTLLTPTDTVYGLACKPDVPAAVARIFALKDRDQQFNLPVMVAGLDDIERLGVELNTASRVLIQSAYMPGALTIVFGFAAGKKRPVWLEGREEVAVRIPNHAWLLSLLRETGPLLVTSANRHQSKINMGDLDQILPDLTGKPDIVIDDGKLNEVASTIVNCRYSPPVIEREGVISAAAIKEILQHG